jgi:hypothetical protein
MHVVNVKVYKIKGTRLPKYLLKQHNMMRKLIHTLFVQA